MITAIELIAEPGGAGRIRETAEVLLLLKSRADDDWEDVLPDLPAWLTSAFAPERTREESEAWLAQWRVAADREAFERESGWTASGWIHWFSAENDMWSIAAVRVDPDGPRLIVDLDHDDFVVPFAAWRWLARVAGLRVVKEP
ncbi:hypothetical protein [Actinoplanes subglobosus]|uniref:Uncharacterized protein n=1 Tax=Actinoplanes subglobosus TaxID=1547892 RepID=A0ABV8IQN8_9ACTN